MGAEERRSDRRETVGLWAGVGILCVEAFAVLVEVAFPSHHVPVPFHGIAAIAATYCFGDAARQAVKRARNGNGA